MEIGELTISPADDPMDTTGDSISVEGERGSEGEGGLPVDTDVDAIAVTEDEEEDTAAGGAELIMPTDNAALVESAKLEWTSELPTFNAEVGSYENVYLY